MSLVVGSLLAKLGLDDSGFSEGMNRAQSSMQQTAKSSQAMQAAVERSAARVQSARASEAAAAVRVTQAEQNLAKVRATAGGDATKLAAAEAKLGSALASANSSRLRTQQATGGLAAAQRAARTAADQLASSQGRATQSTNNLSAAASKCRGTLAALGVGVSLAAVVKGMTDSVAAARALGAQTNQLNVIFGSNAGQITAWGKTAVDSMRMSQREAQGAAIQFATFGKAMGASGQDLVNFSTKTTKLAADLASFQGIPVADAVQAMGSAFAGETETMRQYGVLLDENTIKQAAYKNGVAEVGAQLTVQQKAQGTYYAMQEQLAHVNGDVERSNGKFGASLKTLTARLEETQAAVGQKLIPVIQPFVNLLAGPGLTAVQGIAGAVGTAANAFNSLPGPVQTALAAIVAFKVTTLGLQVANRMLGTSFDPVRDSVRRTGEALRSGMTAARNAGSAFTDLGRTVNVQTSQGQVAMGRFGSAIGRVGQHVPVIARMQQAFVNAAIGAERMPRSAGAFNAAMTGMKAGASGLMGALGGPWGLALTGASVALSMWISKKEEDARKSEEAKAKTQQWTQALVESGGAINANVRQLAAQELQQKGLLKLADESGLGMDRLAKSVTGSTTEWRAAQETIEKYIASQRQNFGTAREFELWANSVRENVNGVRNEFMNGSKAAADMGKATGSTSVSFDRAANASAKSSKAMAEFAESTDGAASKVDKLAKSLSELQDDNLTQEEALQAWSDNMRDLVSAFGDAGAASVKLDGHVDVTTEKGSKLQDAIVKQRDAYNQTAASALEYARSQKMGAGESLDYVTSKLAPMRAELIKSAMDAGVGADAAKKLADTYLGVPSDVITRLQLEGADAAIDKLNTIKVKGAEPVQGTYNMVDNTPEVRKRLDDMKINYSIVDGKVVINKDDIDKANRGLKDLGIQTESLPDGYVKITDTSPENLAHLEQLGIKTQTLPNGTIVINPNDTAFWDAVRRAEQPTSKDVVLNAVVNQAALSAAVSAIAGPIAVPVVASSPRADGAIDEYAVGGIRPAGVPSMPSEAVIERGRGAGLVRWAEGETGWEAYIPGKKNARSTAILREAAHRLGYAIQPVQAFANGAIRTAGQMKSFFQGLSGAPYVLGGWGSGWSTDCSGAQSSGMEYAVGNTESPGGRERSATGGFAAYTAAHGMQPGRAPGGIPAYMVGWSPEHASGTIQDPQGGDVNVEMGGQNGGGAYGGGAVPATDGQFSSIAWMPLLQGDGTDAGAQAGAAPVVLTEDSSREDVARKIIQEGRARGYSDEEIKAVLATAIQESNLDPKAQNGDWKGVFQQDGSYANRDDPNGQVTGFYDKLDEKKKSEGASGDIYKDIYWMQQSPGSSTADAAYAGGRQGYMDEIKSKDDEAAKLLAELGPGLAANNGQGGVPGTAGGSGTPVYVTNWPAGSGSSYTGTGTGTGTPGTGTQGAGTPGTTTAPQRKKLFTLGGGSLYNGSPDNGNSGNSGNSGTGTPKTTAPKASSVAAAQAAVDKAKRSQAESVERQRIAEMKLDEVRANPKSKPSQIAAAEASVEKAKNSNADATDRLRVAEMRLQELQAADKKSGKTTPPPARVKRLFGGTIPGTGRGDIIPMMGEPGEFVVRRDIAQRPGMTNYLAALNAGRVNDVPGYETGGTVGGFTSGFGGYQSPTVAKVKLGDHVPAYWLEQLYRGGVAGFGGAAMAGSAIGTDGSFQGFSTGASSIPILDDIVKKLDEVIKEGRVGSIGLYVGEGGQIVVEDMGDLRKTQDKAAADALLRSAAMRV